MMAGEAVVSVFAEVLGLKRVDPHAGFLDLGGHSLLAIQVIALLRERYGLAVAARQFLQNASAATIAESCRYQEAGRG